MKTMKAVISFVEDEVYVPKFEWVVMGGIFPVAMFRSKQDAEFFVECITKNYPADKKAYYEVRMVIE